MPTHLTTVRPSLYKWLASGNFFQSSSVQYVSCIKRKKEVVKKSLVNKSLDYCAFNVRIRVRIFKFYSICFQSKIMHLSGKHTSTNTKTRLNSQSPNLCEITCKIQSTVNKMLAQRLLELMRGGLPAIRRVYIYIFLYHRRPRRVLYV